MILVAQEGGPMCDSRWEWCVRMNGGCDDVLESVCM